MKVKFRQELIEKLEELRLYAEANNDKQTAAIFCSLREAILEKRENEVYHILSRFLPTSEIIRYGY